MRTQIRVVGLLGVAAVALALGGMLFPHVSAQAGSFHVWTVTTGGASCRDMTNNLRTDRDAWRALYFNYMAGFITGANFVSYSAGGRNANVGLDDASTHEGVFASIEQYCVENPAKNIFEAVTRVYSRLAAR